MKDFYSFLTEVEPPDTVDAEAPLHTYQSQIVNASQRMTNEIAPKLKVSHFTQQDYPSIRIFRIRKGGEIIKISVSIKYEENDTKGICHFSNLAIGVNSFYYNEDNWTNRNFTETLSHELNHAVDHVNGVENYKLTHSKFAQGPKSSYWFSNYEFRSVCMAMRMTMESKMRGFTIEGKGVDPEVLVPALEEYVAAARRVDALADWRRKLDPEEKRELLEAKGRERALMVTLFGVDNYTILLKWRRTPVYQQFEDYMDGLSKEWRKDYV